MDGAWAGCAHVIDGTAHVGGQVRCPPLWPTSHPPESVCTCSGALTARLRIPLLCVLLPCHALVQEHFYLEPNCSLVVPGEAGEVTIISSTQVRQGATSQAQRRTLLLERRSRLFAGDSAEVVQIGRMSALGGPVAGNPRAPAAAGKCQCSMVARPGTDRRAGGACAGPRAEPEHGGARAGPARAYRRPPLFLKCGACAGPRKNQNIVAHVLGLPAHNVFSRTKRLFLLKCSACAGPREEPEHGGARAGPARAQGVQQDQAPGRRLWRQGDSLRARQVCTLAR